MRVIGITVFFFFCKYILYQASGSSVAPRGANLSDHQQKSIKITIFISEKKSFCSQGWLYKQKKMSHSKIFVCLLSFLFRNHDMSTASLLGSCSEV